MSHSSSYTPPGDTPARSSWYRLHQGDYEHTLFNHQRVALVQLLLTKDDEDEELEKLQLVADYLDDVAIPFLEPEEPEFQEDRRQMDGFIPLAYSDQMRAERTAAKDAQRKYEELNGEHRQLQERFDSLNKQHRELVEREPQPFGSNHHLNETNLKLSETNRKLNEKIDSLYKDHQQTNEANRVLGESNRELLKTLNERNGKLNEKGRTEISELKEVLRLKGEEFYLLRQQLDRLTVDYKLAKDTLNDLQDKCADSETTARNAEQWRRKYLTAEQEVRDSEDEDERLSLDLAIEKRKAGHLQQDHDRLSEELDSKTREAADWKRKHQNLLTQRLELLTQQSGPSIEQPQIWENKYNAISKRTEELVVQFREQYTQSLGTVKARLDEASHELLVETTKLDTLLQGIEPPQGDNSAALRLKDHSTVNIETALNDALDQQVEWLARIEPEMADKLGSVRVRASDPLTLFKLVEQSFTYCKKEQDAQRRLILTAFGDSLNTVLEGAGFNPTNHLDPTLMENTTGVEPLLAWAKGITAHLRIQYQNAMGFRVKAHLACQRWQTLERQFLRLAEESEDKDRSVEDLLYKIGMLENHILGS
jgi:chromosome segregation ATPase